jgi:hypothetical protein
MAVTTKQAGETKSLKSWASEQVSRLSAAYPTFRLEESGELYRDEIMEMAERYTRKRTEAAVTRAIREVPDWCPTIAKLRELVPQDSAVTDYRPMRTCVLCRDLFGWEWVTCRSERDNHEYQALRRCRHAGIR